MAADRRRRGGKTIKDRLALLEELLPAAGQKARICAVVYEGCTQTYRDGQIVYTGGQLVKVGRDDGTSELYTGQELPRFGGIKAYVNFDPWARPGNGGV